MTFSMTSMLEPENTCADFVSQVYCTLVRDYAACTDSASFFDLHLQDDDAAARNREGVLDDKSFSLCGLTWDVEAVVYLQDGRPDGHRPGLHVGVRLCKIVADTTDNVQFLGCVPVNDKAGVKALVDLTTRLLVGNAL